MRFNLWNAGYFRRVCVTRISVMDSLLYFVYSGAHQCIHFFVHELVGICLFIPPIISVLLDSTRHQVRPAKPFVMNPVIGLKMSQESSTVTLEEGLFSTLFASVSHEDALSAVSIAFGNALCVPAASCVSLLNFCLPLTYCIVTSEATGRVWLRSLIVFFFLTRRTQSSLLTEVWMV